MLYKFFAMSHPSTSHPSTSHQNKNDMKKLNKETLKYCKLTTSKEKPKEKAECIDINKCKSLKCKTEFIDQLESIITPDDYKVCDDTNSKKFSDCYDKILKKKQTYKKGALLNHCVANKCPQINKLAKKGEHKFLKLLKSYKNKDKLYKATLNCTLKHCKKFKNVIEKKTKAATNETYNCHKKYKDYKQQNKCIDKISPTKHDRDSLQKCRTQHCNKEINNRVKFFKKPTTNKKVNKVNKVSKVQKNKAS